MEDVSEMDMEGLCASSSRSLALWPRLKLLWGRPRRLIYNWFRGDYVQKSLSRRKGQCQRCGACCQLGSRCPALFYEKGLACCKVYDRRKSPNCRTFPIDERDLADRNVLLPQKPCGYAFERKGKA